MLDLFLSKIHVSGWCMAPRIENFLENPVEEQDTCRFSIKGWLHTTPTTGNFLNSSSFLCLGEFSQPTGQGKS